MPVDATTASRLACDTEHIGDLETDELTRVTFAIPAAIRRKVFHRDHFACVVPGCRSTRYLDLHHVVHREQGGDHAVTNLCVLCFGCHKRHHDGDLQIAGSAPDALQFAWNHDDDIDSPMSSPSWDWTPDRPNPACEPGGNRDCEEARSPGPSG